MERSDQLFAPHEHRGESEQHTGAHTHILWGQCELPVRVTVAEIPGSFGAQTRVRPSDKRANPRSKRMLRALMFDWPRDRE
ncbi:hypothetical protein GCM10009843_07340 [Nocardioides bigeumensis]|uniref:Uncharacterized protein n=1 Tax=Nocardioides bigeumensis TaxID=433657 RepID=A0ABN2XT68_9ACTN